MAHNRAMNSTIVIGLLRKRELAQRLSISVRTIENWVSAGRIPCIRVGRVTRFEWERVLEALHAYEQRERTVKEVSE